MKKKWKHTYGPNDALFGPVFPIAIQPNPPRPFIAWIEPK